MLKLFDALRVPQPANIHRDLQRLEVEALARRIGSRWAITPTGERQVQKKWSSFDPAALEAAIAGTPGSYLGNAKHIVIPPALAPPKWLPAIERLLQNYPFETNVFLITRFPASSTDRTYLDPIRTAIPEMRRALADHGLSLHLASDRQLDDDLLGNVAAHMWACQFGIGILEDRIGRGLNSNVLTEIGAMLMTGRRCALFKDQTSPALPTDIVGQIYKSIDLDDVTDLTATVHRWAAFDLALGTCKKCPPR